MSPFPIPFYASQSTREAIKGINTGICQMDAALAAAQQAVDEARALDPMTGDVSRAIAAGNALRRAKVDRLRCEVEIRRAMDPIYPLLSADLATEMKAAEEDLMHCRRKVEQGLTAIGLGHLLAYKDIFGNHPNEALILESSVVAPANRRYLTAKLAAQDGAMRQTNRLELQKVMERLKAEFASAANGSTALPSAPSKPGHVTLDPECGLMSL